MTTPTRTQTPTSNSSIKEPEIPSISLSLEEAALIKEGIEALQPERKKTVVCDRLAMKINMVNSYWQNLEKAKHIKKEQMAAKFKKEDHAK